MSTIIIANARIVDGSQKEPSAETHLLIEGGRIREVSNTPLESSIARVIDLRGKTLMPGLIDCHTHVVASQLQLGTQALMPDSLVTARAIPLLRAMLLRGFTTVRDAGGADLGLQQAVEEGLILGPRLVICGKALSQTGGHSDMRGHYDTRDTAWMSRKLGSLGRVADGAEAVRLAAREELKGGAQFIKIMANGGVASPTDPINYLGYSEAEIRAVVDEAAMARTYVAAHLYTAESIERAVRCGVHSVEHANLVNRAAAETIARFGAIACPTAVVFDALARDGAAAGFPAYAIAKIDAVRLPSREALQHLQDAGVLMTYGTDLIGPLQKYQSEEFLIRREVLPAHEVIRSATLNAARLLRMEGAVGCVESGAHADLIVVNGNPLEDLALLGDQGRHMPLIMKGGVAVKDELG